MVYEDSPDGPSGRLRREASRFAAEHGFSVRPEGHADESANPAGASQQPLSACVKADDHPDNFQCAGQIGANMLTRLLGQPVETLAKNIALYRRTWKEAGHSGEGRVTLLVPTFVSANEQTVKDTSSADRSRPI